MTDDLVKRLLAAAPFAANGHILREAAALIKQQSARIAESESHRNDLADKIVEQKTEIGALKARIAALESAANGEPIYQTCFIQGQWRDVDLAEYERAKGLRDDLARIVYTAPAATDNGGGRDAALMEASALCQAIANGYVSDVNPKRSRAAADAAIFCARQIAALSQKAGE